MNSGKLLKRRFTNSALLFETRSVWVAERTELDAKPVMLDIIAIFLSAGHLTSSSPTIALTGISVMLGMSYDFTEALIFC